MIFLELLNKCRICCGTDVGRAKEPHILVQRPAARLK